MLAGTPELQVAARTSSFSFKGKAMEVPEIAGALKVRMVLEGSVRRQGDRVRITAQLIDAQDGFHVWSQTYDRKLEDIFAIQDEIARAIGEELKVKIAGSARAGQGAGETPNLASHDLYLRGMALWHTRGEQELWDAIAAFEEAAALDPKSAQAFAGLALAYSVVGDYSARVPFVEILARARRCGDGTRAGSRAGRGLRGVGQCRRNWWGSTIDIGCAARARRRPAALVRNGPQWLGTRLRPAETSRAASRRWSAQRCWTRAPRSSPTTMPRSC